MIKFLEHTADVKFTVEGKTLDSAFDECAKALMKVIADEAKIKGKIKKEISLEGEDKKELLYEFLERLLFLLDAEGFVFSKTKVKIKGNSLKSIVWGDKTSNYKCLNHVKSPTYAEMYIKKTKSGWKAQVVLDV